MGPMDYVRRRVSIVSLALLTAGGAAACAGGDADDLGFTSSPFSSSGAPGTTTTATTGGLTDTDSTAGTDTELSGGSAGSGSGTSTATTTSASTSTTTVGSTGDDITTTATGSTSSTGGSSTTAPASTSTGTTTTSSSGTGTSTSTTGTPTTGSSTSSTTGAPSCPTGQLDCDSDGTCETSVTDVNNCGECGKSCVVAGTTLNCSAGTCSGTITFQGPSEIVDTYAEEDRNSSLGGAAELLVDEFNFLQPSDPRYETYIRPEPTLFDEIPLNASVANATLTVSIDDAGDNMTYAEIVSGWDESIGWSSRPAQGTSLGTVSGSQGQRQMNITGTAQKWVNGTLPEAFGITLQPGGGNGVDMRSSEYANPVEGPRIDIQLSY